MTDNLCDDSFNRRESVIPESNINQKIISGKFSIFKSVELLAQSSSYISTEDKSGSSSKSLCQGKEFEDKYNCTNSYLCSPEGNVSNKETPRTKYLLRDFVSQPLFQSTPNSSLSSQDSGIGHDLSAHKGKPLPNFDDSNFHHSSFFSPFFDSGVLSSSGDCAINSFYRNSCMFPSFSTTPVRLNFTPRRISWSPTYYFDSLLHQTSPVQVRIYISLKYFEIYKMTPCM